MGSAALQVGSPTVRKFVFVELLTATSFAHVLVPQLYGSNQILQVVLGDTSLERLSASAQGRVSFDGFSSHVALDIESNAQPTGP